VPGQEDSISQAMSDDQFLQHAHLGPIADDDQPSRHCRRDLREGLDEEVEALHRHDPAHRQHGWHGRRRDTLTTHRHPPGLIEVHPVRDDLAVPGTEPRPQIL